MGNQLARLAISMVVASALLGGCKKKPIDATASAVPAEDTSKLDLPQASADGIPAVGPGPRLVVTSKEVRGDDNGLGLAEFFPKRDIPQHGQLASTAQIPELRTNPTDEERQGGEALLNLDPWLASMKRSLEKAGSGPARDADGAYTLYLYIERNTPMRVVRAVLEVLSMHSEWNLALVLRRSSRDVALPFAFGSDVRTARRSRFANSPGSGTEQKTCVLSDVAALDEGLVTRIEFRGNTIHEGPVHLRALNAGPPAGTVEYLVPDGATSPAIPPLADGPNYPAWVSLLEKVTSAVPLCETVSFGVAGKGTWEHAARLAELLQTRFGASPPKLVFNRATHTLAQDNEGTEALAPLTIHPSEITRSAVQHRSGDVIDTQAPHEAPFDSGSAPSANAVQVKMSLPEIQGEGLTRLDVQRTLMRKTSSLTRCYETGLAQAPNLTGVVTVEFVIDKEGAVTKSEVTQSTVTVASVNTCIADVLRGLRFPPTLSGLSITATETMTLDFVAP